MWDDEACVWIASNDELGISTEAESLDPLPDKLRRMLPEAVELNGLTPEDDSVPYDLLVHDSQRNRVVPPAYTLKRFSLHPRRRR